MPQPAALASWLKTSGLTTIAIPQQNVAESARHPTLSLASCHSRNHKWPLVRPECCTLPLTLTFPLWLGAFALHALQAYGLQTSLQLLQLLQEQPLPFLGEAPLDRRLGPSVCLCRHMASMLMWCNCRCCKSSHPPQEKKSSSPPCPPWTWAAWTPYRRNWMPRSLLLMRLCPSPTAPGKISPLVSTIQVRSCCTTVASWHCLAGYILSPAASERASPLVTIQAFFLRSSHRLVQTLSQRCFVLAHGYRMG